MTKSDVHKSFKLLMDKNAETISFGGCPAFLTEEIDTFLDQATLQVISNKFNGTQNNTQFEGTTKRISDLQELVKTTTVSNGVASNHISNLISFDLPEDFMYYVGGYVTVGSGIDALLLLSHENAKKFALTNNNNPYIPDAIADIQENKIQVYYDVDKEQPDSIWLDYLIKPNKFIDIEPETQVQFNDSLTNEIINRAVLIALDNIESQRTQIKAQLNNIQE